MKELAVINLGRTCFKDAWGTQRRIFESRKVGETTDVLLLTEHHHVYTFGKSSDDNHLLADEDTLKNSGIDVFHIDRGGDVTYHGPGQLVGYPILDLNNYYCDVHRYLRDLEEVIIRTLAEFGISSRRDGDYTGVWVGNDKIAAIGVKISRWITMHGFALNVNTDLSYFERIIPCGIFHKGVTSMQQVLGKTVSLETVSNVLRQKFADVFGCVLLEDQDIKFLHTKESSELQMAEHQ
jgi:lipoate-protein ligase B